MFLYNEVLLIFMDFEQYKKLDRIGFITIGLLCLVLAFLTGYTDILLTISFIVIGSLGFYFGIKKDFLDKDTTKSLKQSFVLIIFTILIQIYSIYRITSLNGVI